MVRPKLLELALVGLAFMPASVGAVTVSVDPPDLSVGVGNEFELRIATDAFPDLKGFALVFSYDPTRLELLSLREGEVLTSPGGNYLTFQIPDVAAPDDTIWYEAVMLDGATQGPGVLLYARFQALATGDALINCLSVDFRDSYNVSTVPACGGGIVRIGAEPPFTVKISQVYGGGGDAGATLRNDYIELFNAGESAVSLLGWTVQYGLPTGSSWQATALSGTIAPGGYYLVQEAQGAGGTVDLPVPDATGSIDMSATGGRVTLLADSTLLFGACRPLSSMRDRVGYGETNCYEGLAPAGTTSVDLAAYREYGGCLDTDDNFFDFELLPPAPRNSSSPTNLCSLLDVDPAPRHSDISLGIAPNPSRGPVRLHFTLPREGDVRLRIFDVQGRTVATIANDFMSAGHHVIGWSSVARSGPAPPGVYFVHLQANGMDVRRSLVIAH